MTTRGRQSQTADSSHVVADQSEVAAFLAGAGTYGPDTGQVLRLDTHAAMVFLAGRRAYKVKRAVKFPYMDFSTLARRRACCLKEVEVNRRTAPDLYLGVEAVTRRPDGGLALGGDGPAVEWLVVMERFRQEDLFDRLAADGKLTPQLMADATDAITSFHAEAEQLFGDGAKGGGVAGLGWVVEENCQELAERPDLFPADQVADFTARSRAQLERAASLLDQRLEEGFVRHCHGDLHLRNICLIDGRATLFDAIEFNDVISTIDVLYDLAFLLMDLDHRDLRPYANLALNRYLQDGEALSALAVLPIFLSARATIRAKVSASAEASQAEAQVKARLHNEAIAYFRLAAAYLDPPLPRLVAIGGLSGTGKTSLARRLAPDLGAAPGALHLRSDVLRKRLSGVAELTPLPQAAYGREMTERVYGEILTRAREALGAGHSVIVDAVYAQATEREALEAVARDLDVPFQGLWLTAPEPTMAERVTGRRGNASDATAEVVRQQLSYDVGAMTWQRIDSNGPLDAVVAAAAGALREKA
jgi:aminoglycoside phosphotransferase family enzyme/predicted kinase